MTYVTSQSLHETIRKLPPADELFIGQNNTEVSRALRVTHPEAIKACYGDGVGLNFTNGYYDPNMFNRKQASRKSSRFPLAIRNWLLARRSRRKEGECNSNLETASEFDVHCLLLPNRFDQTIDQVDEVGLQEFIQLFRCFGERIEVEAPESHSILRAVQSRAGRLHVLLTSNFTETGRMSLDGEISGYLDTLGRCTQADNVQLLIKPHPRDSREKLEKLVESLGDRYQHVAALTDRRGFYFPFEAVFSGYLKPVWGESDKLDIATVSSSCLSLELLYGQRCVQGFGAQASAAQFAPLWAPLRQKHEADLLRIVDEIRSDQATDSRAA
ncbi:MAG: hypothetical protein Aurels2KO_21190 [Aureliella sp.]